jgi:hypothetical protein
MYQPTNRQRSECIIAVPLWGVETQPITCAADGMDELRFEGIVDLAAQREDMDVDHIGNVVEVIVPDMVGYRRAREDLIGVAHQELEQTVLFTGQRNNPIPTPDFVAHRIQDQIGNLKHVAF